MTDEALEAVHGDIRHLETIHKCFFHCIQVHGDIRHLERELKSNSVNCSVHGDIRHLENKSLERL